MPPAVNGSFMLGHTRWMRISSESAMPNKHREQRQEPILNSDDLVVDAEDVFSDEAGRRMVMAAAFVCHHRIAPRTIRTRLRTCYCCCNAVSWSCIHLSNSSWETTFRKLRMW